MVPATLCLLVFVGLTINSADSASIHKENETEPLIDGYLPMNISDSNTENVAIFAASQISSAYLSEPVKLMKIVRADSEIFDTHGVKVNMTVELEKGVDTILVCEVLVFGNTGQDAQWTKDDLTLIDYTCLPATNGSIEDNVLPVSQVSSVLNDTKINDIVGFATDTIITNINAETTLNLAEIVKAEWQSTSTSINYKLTLKLTGLDGEDTFCEAIVSDPTNEEATKTRELSYYSCSLIDESSVEFEVDIPEKAILSKWLSP
ncbi:uncharacterized protein LOC130699383 [Daphnia carinata]|uniref:uncharacterized protein LOC130699383 n=1 Tax=Daphnia carinata TaxID=120202 RepID=UPI00257E7221|nr:uncharacterized protein LOC130699383 [Daphnia carinata]